MPVFVAETRFSADAFRLFRWRAPETRKQTYLETLLAREDHAKEVKLFGLGPLFLGRYRAIFSKLFGEDRALTLRRGVWGFGLGLLSTLAFYGAYGWIVLRAVQGAITLGDMTMYLLVFKQGQSRARRDPARRSAACTRTTCTCRTCTSSSSTQPRRSAARRPRPRSARRHPLRGRVVRVSRRERARARAT